MNPTIKAELIHFGVARAIKAANLLAEPERTQNLNDLRLEADRYNPDHDIPAIEVIDMLLYVTKR
ncbi:MAG: hypothetical protein WC648_00320 [Candidatus Paceibacterota bacterium]|jgi:hypothetical protein